MPKLIELFAVTPHALWILTIIFGRIFGIMLIFPLFSSNRFTSILKATMAWTLAGIIYPFVVIKYPLAADFSAAQGVILTIKELFVGFLVGYILSVPFWLIESIGNFIDTQRGGQIGAIMNQLTKNNSSIIGKFFTIAFITYFISINGMIFTFNTIFSSYQILNPFEIFAINKYISTNQLINIFSEYFMLVVLLSFPVLISCLLIDLILGVISSFVPQMNITIMSVGLKTPVAIFITILYISSLFHYISSKFSAIIN
jgi:type III secretion protein T